MFIYFLSALALFAAPDFALSQDHAPSFRMDRRSEKVARRADPDFFKRVPVAVHAPEVRQIERTISRFLGRDFKVHSILKKEAFNRSNSGTYWIRYRNERGLLELRQFFIQNGDVAWTREPILVPDNPNHLLSLPQNDFKINDTTIVTSPIFDVPGITDNSGEGLR